MICSADPFCWAADILANHSNGDIFAWGGDGKDWYRDGEHTDQWCRDNTIPASYALQAHTAPLGLTFYDGRGRYAFPPEYYNQIIVAEHGSWNSDSPRGYKLARIGTDEHGEALASTSRDFFAYKGPGAAWPQQVRPVEVRVGPEGELYVSSDSSSQIIVIRHINDRHTPVLMPQLVSAGYNYSTIGGPTKASAEFSFDVPRTRGTYRWREGTYPRQGVAQFDGASLFVNMSAADNAAGAAAPNITGGNSTYEMWINIDAIKPADASAYMIILELLEPGYSTAQDDYLRIWAQVSADGSSAQLAASSQQPGRQSMSTQMVTVPTGSWQHITLQLNGGLGTLCANGENCLRPVALPVPVMWRHSALLGTSYRYTKGGQLSNFTGYLDDVRLYSYAISGAQMHLNYILSADSRTNPVLQANLHMQPPENSEPNFYHVGPANRYGPQPPAALFPGWVYLNGSQLIELSNPMSGLGHAWRGDLWAGGMPAHGATMTLEFWFRLARLDELASGVTLLNAQPVARVYWSQKQLQVMVGKTTFPVTADKYTPTTGWTHFVFVASEGQGGSSYYTSYINGTVVASASGPTFAPTAVELPVTLGGGVGTDGSSVTEGLNGDLGAFRVYDFDLNATHVDALFKAQIQEGERMRMQARERGIAVEGESKHADSDDGFPVMSAAQIVGVVVAVSVVVTALVLLCVWRVQKARGAVMLSGGAVDGYSAELMSDAR